MWQWSEQKKNIHIQSTGNPDEENWRLEWLRLANLLLNTKQLSQMWGHDGDRQLLVASHTELTFQGERYKNALAIKDW